MLCSNQRRPPYAHAIRLATHKGFMRTAPPLACASDPVLPREPAGHSSGCPGSIPRCRRCTALLAPPPRHLAHAAAAAHVAVQAVAVAAAHLLQHRAPSRRVTVRLARQHLRPWRGTQGVNTQRAVSTWRNILTSVGVCFSRKARAVRAWALQLPFAQASAGPRTCTSLRRRMRRCTVSNLTAIWSVMYSWRRLGSAPPLMSGDRPLQVSMPACPVPSIVSAGMASSVTSPTAGGDARPQLVDGAFTWLRPSPRPDATPAARQLGSAMQGRAQFRRIDSALTRAAVVAGQVQLAKAG